MTPRPEDPADALRRTNELFERAQRVGRIGCWSSEFATPPEDGALWWSEQVFVMFGVDPARFDGRNATFFSRVPAEDRAAISAAAQRAIDEHRPYECEHRVVRPDGSVRWVREWAEVERDAQGRPVRLIGACQDVTERRLIEERLRHAERMDSVARLAGGVAHDFNNLLTVILGSLELAERRLSESRPADRQLAECRAAAERAADLTGRLLTFARRPLSAPQPTDVGRVTEECLPLLRRLAGEAVAVEFERDPELWHALTDPSQWERLLVDLVANARNAMPQGGRIRMRLRNAPGRAGEGGDRVELTVADEGGGVAPADRERIFEPFFATKEARVPGLGLAACYGIVTHAGGTIAAEDAPGGGALFRILLPRTAAPPQPSAGDRVASAAATVLVVEDEDALRRLVAAVLEGAGYSVLTAADGHAALELAGRRDASIDLVLADVVMPGLDGRRTVERLREQRPELRALFMSGYNDDPKIRAVPGQLLLKPFTPAALLERVRQALAG